MTPRCFLGVDAGNTKTDAVLVDEHGTLLGEGHAGRGDIYPGLESAVEEVRRAVEGALLGMPEGGVLAHSAFRLAGVDWTEDEQLWRSVIHDTWDLPGTTSILNDGFAPIRLHSPDGQGLAVAAGTYSAFAGRGPAGEFSMNMLTMHELGAHALGAAAVQAVGCAQLGIGPQTALTEAVAAHVGMDGGGAVIHALRSRVPTLTERDYPGLAPLVTAAAANGDAAARRIVADQVALIATYTELVAQRVGFDREQEVPIALNGSVIRNSAYFADAVQTAVRERLADAVFGVADAPPVIGAALDALGESGIELTAHDAARLVARYAERAAPPARTRAAQTSSSDTVSR